MDSTSKKPDLYEILGVSRNATEDEIKKAYKKQAVKLHPDRNPNNQEESNRQFQELNRAAKILTNQDSRSRYDKFGVIDGDAEQPGGQGMNPFEIIENFFNGGLFGGLHRGNINQNQNQNSNPKNGKSPDKKLTINLSLADVYLGKQVPIDFVKMVCCDMCQGRGAKNMDSIITCNSCNGQGRIVRMMQMGPMIQQSVQPCNSCMGKGKIIKPGGECVQCYGKKSIGIKRHLDCYVRPGSQPGNVITFKNEADWHSDFTDVGDVLVFVNSKNEEGGFQREGDNLIMKRSISLLESLTNTVFYFKHLDNRVIKVVSNNIIHPNQKMIIKGEGMPNLQDNLVKGDIIIIFDVKFPNILDKERAKYLVKILPIPKKQIWDLQMETTPENELTSYIMEPYQDSTSSRQTNTHNTHNIHNTHNTHYENNESQEDEDSTNTTNNFNIPGPVECTTQ